jgi:Cu/Ag efflux protein CusF
MLSPVWQACGGTSDSEVGAPEPAVYVVRGVVRQIRQIDDGKTQLSILHEAIPDFVGINGDVVGMKSMTMPFIVADSVDMTGIEPGSRVQIELSVDWNRTEPGLIGSIEFLPEDAVLSFEKPD